MEWYLNNREIIQNLSINTGTSASPTFTTMCTTSEIEVTEFEQTDWYVFAMQRSLITGVALSRRNCKIRYKQYCYSKY